MKRAKGYMIVTGVAIFLMFGAVGGLELNRISNAEFGVTMIILFAIAVGCYSRATVLYNRARRKETAVKREHVEEVLRRCRNEQNRKDT